MVAPMTSDAAGFIGGEIAKVRAGLDALQDATYTSLLEEISVRIMDCLRGGGKVMFCGNGGSAADAQHLAAELVGRQNYDRPAAAGIALTVDTSCLTAISNDYGYETVFSRQVEALGVSGDILIGISTSGNSKNVVRALATANERCITTISFTGIDPREMAIADYRLCVPARETAKIQELHIICGHIIFALVELGLFPKETH